MTTKRIGAVTIGQSPRVDVTPDVLPILGPDVELIQAGALDFVDDVAQVAPQGDEDVLVSRLRDGGSVRIAEPRILPYVQRAIDEVAAQGASSIMVWCTGEFPDSIRSSVPLVYPNRLISGVVGALGLHHVGVMLPDGAQVEQMRDRWERIAGRATILAASPYGPQSARDEAARTLADADVELIVLDCIGFTEAMRSRVRELSGKPVMLPRALLARTMLEIL